MPRLMIFILLLSPLVLMPLSAQEDEEDPFEKMYNFDQTGQIKDNAASDFSLDAWAAARFHALNNVSGPEIGVSLIFNRSYVGDQQIRQGVMIGTNTLGFSIGIPRLFGLHAGWFLGVDLLGDIEVLAGGSILKF